METNKHMNLCYRIKDIDLKIENLTSLVNTRLDEILNKSNEQFQMLLQTQTYNIEMIKQDIIKSFTENKLEIENKQLNKRHCNNSRLVKNNHNQMIIDNEEDVNYDIDDNELKRKISNTRKDRYYQLLLEKEKEKWQFEYHQQQEAINQAKEQWKLEIEQQQERLREYSMSYLN